MKPLFREQINKKSQNQPKGTMINKKITKKIGPRLTRTIKETLKNAQVTQPSAGMRKLPRQNRRNKLARQYLLRRKL
ncbi:unnamed protein product (macronuclear) [Paramecium tetraurelia]|uniref:Uncharacterized protein n=1 Tax=Paramecium tetraurelia TaxID=5888 RepID=A0E8A2_PARTE|nr:uncharacterized protein GSPATT00024247001 [Paramecium tetraurelia]CAK91519.1 unnamed protein product [Paramecium tetraurelia]|eukprot:XP_001458916.1 hypothetical protein (macronuclear) [Paramecium tetraurelia strain d4-2]